jgi:hypothetical protein
VTRVRWVQRCAPLPPSNPARSTSQARPPACLPVLQVARLSRTRGVAPGPNRSTPSAKHGSLYSMLAPRSISRAARIHLASLSLPVQIGYHQARHTRLRLALNRTSVSVRVLADRQPSSTSYPAPGGCVGVGASSVGTRLSAMAPDMPAILWSSSPPAATYFVGARTSIAQPAPSRVTAACRRGHQSTAMSGSWRSRRRAPARAAALREAARPRPTRP